MTSRLHHNTNIFNIPSLLCFAVGWYWSRPISIHVLLVLYNIFCQSQIKWITKDKGKRANPCVQRRHEKVRLWGDTQSSHGFLYQRVRNAPSVPMPWHLHKQNKTQQTPVYIFWYIMYTLPSLPVSVELAGPPSPRQSAVISGLTATSPMPHAAGGGTENGTGIMDI